MGLFVGDKLEDKARSVADWRVPYFCPPTMNQISPIFAVALQKERLKASKKRGNPTFFSGLGQGQHNKIF